MAGDRCSGNNSASRCLRLNCISALLECRAQGRSPGPRRQEKGILQQLLLFVCAVPLHSRTAQLIGGLPGAPFADVSAAEAAADGTAGAAGQAEDTGPGQAATQAAAPGSPGASLAQLCLPVFRLFVVARRVTVSLVDRSSDLVAPMLDVEARPFISSECQQDSNLCT